MLGTGLFSAIPGAICLTKGMLSDLLVGRTSEITGSPHESTRMKAREVNQIRATAGRCGAQISAVCQRHRK